ncbi:MAG TPA: hypothetical protein VF214_09710 [Edaphobacter sp.]
MKQVALALTFACATAIAQQAPATPAPAPKPLVGSIASRPDWPKAKPEDVGSVEAIVAALYDVISGPKGQPRDWDRMRSLFIPDARLIPARIDRDTHRADAIVLTVDGYIERSSPTMSANGFFEHSIHNEVEQFGNIVHVWSTYESRHNADDPQPFARGINSIQLLKSGERYYVIEVLWDSERPDNPIPAKYLPK